MAEKHPSSGDSANGRSIPMLPCLSSNGTSPSRPTELQPYSLNRMSSPSNQSSIVVPVRLDVLLFLLNSAARGAQYTLPPTSMQGGQGSPSTCHQGPAAQHVPNCCGCPSTSQSVYQPCGSHQYRRDYSGHVGVMESRDNRQGRDVSSYQSDRKSWPAASSTEGWKVPQSPMGWQEKPRREGRGRDNRDNWQGRQENFSRSWGDRRHSAGDSDSWKSSSQSWRKERSAFGSSYTNNKRTHEGCFQLPWDAPDAKRSTDNARVGWLKDQGTKSTSFLVKPADDGPSKPAVQENGEDWETDYERSQASSSTPLTISYSSHSDVPPNISREDSASTDDPPKLRPLTSPVPELASKTQAVAAAPVKPPVASSMDESKNGGFVSYLKNLYSDLPKESSSQGSLDLVIDTDVESSKLDEEEQSPDNEAGGESKSLE